MRLIDADAWEAFFYEHMDDKHMAAAKNALDEMPTVDAVPVVRCKDCKYSEYWYKDKRRCFLWYEAGIDTFEDGFCSYGGRRTDATD